MKLKPKVLVVEDEPIIAKHVGESLHRLGYDVPATVSDAEGAFLAASATRPDLVLMDIDLEGPSDGIEAATKIYSELNIPVVFLTAHDDMPTLHRAQEADAFGYMSKPVVRVHLANSIETALRRHEKHVAQQVRQAWLEAQLKSVGEGLIAANHDGTIWFINPEGERLLGVSAADVLGCSFHSAVPLRHHLTGQAAPNLARLAFLQGMTVNIGEEYIVDRPGNRRIAGEIAISRFEGEAIGVVFTFRDNTVQAYRRESLSNSIVGQDSLDCTRQPVDLVQSLREMEPRLREALSPLHVLSISVDESSYPILSNPNILEAMLRELVGKAQEKLGEQGSVSVVASNLDFEQRKADGSLTHYVRLRITYHRGGSPARGAMNQAGSRDGLCIDLSMARIQSALQALRATAHEGSAPGLTYYEIDIPALNAGSAPAATDDRPAALVVVVEPDADVRSALCHSSLAASKIECLGARDTQEALDWVRMLPGQIDVVVVSEADANSSEITTLLEESPTTSIMLITKEQVSTRKLLQQAPAAALEHPFSLEQLCDKLESFLAARATAPLLQAA